jgi:hypothetical protein
MPAVIDTWRELVDSLNDTHACFPDDPTAEPGCGRRTPR